LRQCEQPTDRVLRINRSIFAKKILTSGGVTEEDLVQDGWTEIIRNLVSMAKYLDKDTNWEDVPKLMELADFEKMEQVRARVETQVSDPATVESLKPYYRQFCKRPCFHDEYLPTFNRETVELIDTDGKGVDAITETGVVANGREYPLDCLIFATGFEVGTNYTQRSGYDVSGRNHLGLSEKWHNGVRTFHGMHTHGFPNLFIQSNTQSAITINFPHAMDELAKHISYIVDECLNSDISTIDATIDAEDDWVARIISLSSYNEEFQATCTPGY